MPHATGMSDAHHPVGGPATPGHPPYDRPPRQALGEMPAEVRAAWRGRYITEAEAELRVQALLDRAEAALRPGGAPVTIRTLWIALADRVGRSDDAALRAAAHGGHGHGIATILTAAADGREALSLFRCGCSLMEGAAAARRSSRQHPHMARMRTSCRVSVALRDHHLDW